MKRYGCAFILLELLLLFSPAFSQQDPRCKRKNEVFSECTGCEETCQTKKPYTCVCTYGCKCKEGFKLNENNNECVPKWNCPFTGAGGQRNPAISDSPVADAIFGQPISAVKDVNVQLQTGTKDVGKYVGNLWNQFSQDSEDVVSGIYSVSVKSPVHNIFYLMNRALQSSGTWGKRAYVTFIDRPILSIRETAEDFGLQVLKHLRNIGDFSKKVYDQAYDSFLRKPLRALGDIFNQIWRYMNKFLEYLWNIVKVLSLQAYEYGIQKPMEFGERIMIGLRIVSERVTQWATKNLNNAIVKGYNMFVVQPYKATAKLTDKFNQQLKSVYSYINTATNDVYGKLYDAFLRKPVNNLNDYWEYLKKNVFPQYYKTFVQYPYDAMKKAFSSFYDQTKSALDKMTEQTKLFFQRSSMQTQQAFKSASDTANKYFKTFNNNFIKDPAKAMGSFSRKVNQEVAQMEDKARNKMDEMMQKSKMMGKKSEMDDDNKSFFEDMEKPHPVNFGESAPPGLVHILMDGADASEEIKNLVTTEGSALVDLIMKTKPDYITEPKKQVESKYARVNIGDGLIEVPPQLEIDRNAGKEIKEMEMKRKASKLNMLDEHFKEKAKETFEKDKEMEKLKKDKEYQQIDAAREDLIDEQQNEKEKAHPKKQKKMKKLKKKAEESETSSKLDKANMVAPTVINNDRKPVTFPL